VLSGRVAQLRPVYLPPDPGSRTSYVAGQIGRRCCTWRSRGRRGRLILGWSDRQG
jgi:hypothetical protein